MLEENTLENYLLVALVVIGLWIAGFVMYLFTSNRQVDLEAEIAQIDAALDAEEADTESY